jgi:hypothetical protein
VDMSVFDGCMVELASVAWGSRSKNERNMLVKINNVVVIVVVVGGCGGGGALCR